MTMKAARCHLHATAIAVVIATTIATMGKALPSSDNRIQPGCGDGGSVAMAARQGRRRGEGGGDGGGDGGGKGGSRWTRQDKGAGRRRRQWRCVGPEISLPLGVVRRGAVCA
jgi:hypothetical protein